ncbi:MAG: hypothetical protein EG826_11400, partial [Deltaproteobacteria bacterium]|nr:hypothetical protein [Deltaproteobacteria bacterium]
MKRKSKLLAISIPLIIVMAALAVYQYGIADIYRQAQELGDEQDAKLKLLAKYSALIARKPAWEKKIADLKQTRKNEEHKMVAAPTAAVACANLQSSVKGIITGRAGANNSERGENAEGGGKFKLIRVTAEGVFRGVRVRSDTSLPVVT